MDYKNSKIYVIRNHCNDFVYIGSTTQSLSKRFSCHKAKKSKKYQLYQAFEELGNENFYIELLELYPCSCRDELCSKEGEYIRKFDSYKNGYNMRIAGRSIKEYSKDNKDRIKQKSKEYYEENIESIKKKNNKYYYENKEQFKKYREDNKDKMKKYYEDNKEDILEYKKAYYIDNREKIREKQTKKFNCECGGKYTQINKSHHLKTKKHLKYIENNLKK